MTAEQATDLRARLSYIGVSQHELSDVFNGSPQSLEATAARYGLRARVARELALPAGEMKTQPSWWVVNKDSLVNISNAVFAVT